MDTESALRQLYPSPSGAVDLPLAYAFPDVDRPWLRANFVSSVDGAATIGGRSGGLGNDADRRIFALLRALADVILVGSGTARVEGYGPAEIDPEWRSLRADRTATPPIAVVSHALQFDLSAPLFAAAPPDARTIVVTDAAASPARRREVAEVAEVIVAGEDHLDPAAAIGELARRGYRRISCEGGPRLLATILAADCLDELCLTSSPVLVAGSSPRITDGPAPAAPVALRLAHELACDGYLFLRYTRAEHGGAR